MSDQKIYYSASKSGFYNTELHGKAMPDDAVEISAALHESLMHAQLQGKRIVAGEDGQPIAADPPPPSREQLIQRAEKAVRAHLDGAAKQLGYDSIDAAIGYADEPSVPRYQAEGLLLRAWRSQVWDALYRAIAESEDAGLGVPSVAELIAALPPVPQVPQV